MLEVDHIYIYLLLVCILSPRKKWNCNRGLKKHSLIGMHLSLVESTLTHCDFKYLCPFRRTHVGHQIGFLETSKHKFLKHPKTKAKKRKLFLGVSIFACPPALGWWFQPIPAAFLKRLSLCCHLPFVGGQQRICEVSLTNKEMCADLKEKRQKST